MALTPEQKSSRLFKKSFGSAETLLARDFFEEPKLGKDNILPNQIWSEADSIPTTAPTLSNGQEQGVVKYYEKLELTHIAGSQSLSYYDDSLKDAIPFNFGDGTYNYQLFKNDGTTQIAFGEGDWLLDTSAGVLTFYGTLPSSVSDVLPPKISFYQYIGEKGLGSVSGATSGINVKDPVIAATTGQTDATYSTATSGFTSLPSNIDGVTSFNDGDRFLIKDQTTAYENGIYEVSGSTLIRAYDHDGTPVGEVGVNDYCFVTSGLTNIAKSYVLGSTDAENPDIITPGIDSQNWKLFSEGLSYTADGQGIKLDGTTFSLDLDDTSGSSGLYQSVDGLRLDTTISNTISTNESTINILTGETSSLSTALSTEISTTDSQVTSLSTAIGNIDFTSLENEITGNTSNITSLDTALSTEISTTNAEITSLSTSIGNIDYTSLENAITGNTSDITSLNSALSTEISTTDFDISSLESALSTLSGNTTDIATILGDGEVLGLSGGQLTGFTYVSDIQSLSTAIGNVDFSSIDSALSTEISTTDAEVTSLSSSISTTDSNVTDLSTALSTEISTTNSEITSLETSLNNFSGVTESTAGSGLTYLAGNQTLNINVDDYTIKIVNDELRTPETWVETDKTTTIASGTGATNIQLDYEPVGYVAAFINGIEYIVSPTPGSSATDMPFYFSSLPVQGSTLYFDADIAGFGIESGVDLITVKYSYISMV